MPFDAQTIVEHARQFSEAVIRPQAGQFEAQGVPGEMILQLAEEGFLGAILPIEYGGLGLGALAYGQLTEAIGKGCPAVRAMLTVHTSLVGETLARLGTPAQKERYLPAMARGEKIACFALSEADAGSDAAAINTRYVETPNHYRLSGAKKWITYAGIADLFLVLASCDGVISAFLLEREMPGITTRPMQGLMASRGAHLAEIELNNVLVPKQNMVGQPGSGFSFVANTALYYGRYSIAWGGVAIAAAAVEEMVTYARSRSQFGKKIGQYQLIQGLIADSVTALHAARAMCENIGRLRDDNDERAVMETNIAKYFTSKAAVESSANAVQVLGGNGLVNAYPVERLFREAKVLEIIEGTSQIQQLMIAKYSLRRYFRKELRRPLASTVDG